MIDKGLAAPLPDWIPYLPMAEKWGTTPWRLVAEVLGIDGPSPAWWMGKQSILTHAESIAHERQMAEAKSKNKTKH